MAEEQKSKEPSKNWSFEYRHIIHVEVPTEGRTEDVFRAGVIQKYKNIDAGLSPDGSPKKGAPAAAFPARNDLAPKDKDFKEIYRDKAMVKENEELRRRLAEVAVVPDEPVVIPHPEVPRGVGAGICPLCDKFYRRLDMHVCKKAKRK